MRALVLFAISFSLSAAAQPFLIPKHDPPRRSTPLPIWEQFDSTHCVLSGLPYSHPWPDTLWAMGHIPVPMLGFDTVVVDQCCIDPDPTIVLGRLQQWPKNAAGERLPLYAERLDADTAAWFGMGEWYSMPDTMIPLTANPNHLVRYIWKEEGLVVQEQHYGKWHYKFPYHVKRSECITEARDSLKLTRCTPHAGYHTTEPTLLLFFVNDKLVHVFQDTRGTGIDGGGYFTRSSRAPIITAHYGGHGAVLFSSGEVLTCTPLGWGLYAREEAIYSGECDCE